MIIPFLKFDFLNNKNNPKAKRKIQNIIVGILLFDRRIAKKQIIRKIYVIKVNFLFLLLSNNINEKRPIIENFCIYPPATASSPNTPVKKTPPTGLLPKISTPTKY